VRNGFHSNGLNAFEFAIAFPEPRIAESKSSPKLANCCAELFWLIDALPIGNDNHWMTPEHRDSKKLVRNFCSDVMASYSDPTRLGAADFARESLRDQLAVLSFEQGRRIGPALANSGLVYCGVFRQTTRCLTELAAE